MRVLLFLALLKRPKISLFGKLGRIINRKLYAIKSEEQRYQICFRLSLSKFLHTLQRFLHTMVNSNLLSFNCNAVALDQWTFVKTDILPPASKNL